MAITDWPTKERPREKLMKHGAQSLSDAELLAIFIRTGVAGSTALDIAHGLLNQYGNLRHLLDADLNQLSRIPGIGTNKYAQLQAGLELGKRYLHCKIQRGKVLSTSQDTRLFIASQLRHYPHEVFACLFLDTHHRIISFDKLFHGTIDAAFVYPREVVRQAIVHNAAAIILAHNHPSGEAKPSPADEHITKLLKQALEMVNICLLDHLIVGDNEVMSFAEWGLINGVKS